MQRLKQWCEDATAASGTDGDSVTYGFVYVDQAGFEKHPPAAFGGLVSAFSEYQ